MRGLLLTPGACLGPLPWRAGPSEAPANPRAGGRAFSTQQERNLGLLKQLLDLSLDENQAIAHFILSFEDQQRAASFLQDYRLAGGALLRQQIAQD